MENSFFHPPWTLVMPFGLNNIPAVFQALVNDGLHDFLNIFVFVYFDIFIYSTNLLHIPEDIKQYFQGSRIQTLPAKIHSCGCLFYEADIHPLNLHMDSRGHYYIWLVK